MRAVTGAHGGGGEVVEDCGEVGGEGDAEVVDCWLRGWGWRGGGRVAVDVELVDADCVVELDRWERLEVWH